MNDVELNKVRDIIQLQEAKALYRETGDGLIREART
jgi:hypothetical protein